MAVRVPFRLFVFLADIMSYTFFLASTYVLCATRTMSYLHLKDLIPIDGLLVRLNWKTNILIHPVYIILLEH